MQEIQEVSHQNRAGAFIAGVLVTLMLVGVAGGAIYLDRSGLLQPIEKFLPPSWQQQLNVSSQSSSSMSQKVLTEESVVIDVADKASPGVVTVSI